MTNDSNYQHEWDIYLNNGSFKLGKKSENERYGGTMKKFVESICGVIYSPELHSD